MSGIKCPEVFRESPVAKAPSLSYSSIDIPPTASWASGSGASLRKEGGPCFFWVRAMKLNIYVDAFNLYYGSLMGTAYRWLGRPEILSRHLSQRPDQSDSLLHRPRSGRNPHDLDKHIRQATYLRASQTLANFTIQEGSYIKKPVMMLRHPIPAPPTLPTLVKVVRSEEKARTSTSPRTSSWMHSTAILKVLLSSRTTRTWRSRSGWSGRDSSTR